MERLLRLRAGARHCKNTAASSRLWRGVLVVVVLNMNCAATFSSLTGVYGAASALAVFWRLFSRPAGALSFRGNKTLGSGKTTPDVCKGHLWRLTTWLVFVYTFFAHRFWFTDAADESALTSSQGDL